MEKDFVLLCSISNQFEAELIKGMLIDNDIPCIIFNKQGSPYHIFGNLELYVHSSQVEEAQVLLNQHNE